MASTSSAGMQRHFWQSSQHTHAARGGGGGGGGTDAPSVLHGAFPAKSADMGPEFFIANLVAGSRLPI